jgi:CubicO group peptidase (beta-lactamase class C family)
MRAATLAVCLLSIVNEPLAAQDTSAGDALAGFDAYVSQAVMDWEVPGLAVAVVKDDSVVFAKGYGVLRLGDDEPVNVHTLFANASTTKAFTSMAVAMMVDAGKLSWNDRVSEYVPEFVLYDPYPTREITIRDLLSHRVGFGDPWYLWWGVDVGFREMIGRLQYVEPQSSFRSAYAYNNVSFATAGTIAGRVDSTTWDDLVTKRILEPLGMEETVTQALHLQGLDNVTAIHDVIDDTLREISDTGVGLVDPIAPAGSMYSSVMDMTRWLRFLLNEGRVGDEQLVSDAAFAELFRPQTIIPVGNFYPTAQLTQPRFTAYGFGWFLQDYRGEFVAFHTGSIDGTVAIVGMLPDHELGVVVFANRDHTELRHALMLRVFDAYLGEPRRDWSVELKELYDGFAAEAADQEKKFQEERVANTTPTLPLAEYAGTYTDRLFGSVTISTNGDALVLERSPYLTADLEHWHYDTFLAVYRNRWVGEGTATFVIGNDGKVKAMELMGATLSRVQDEEGN